MPHQRFTAGLLGGLLAALSAAVWADGSATWGAGGQSMSIAWRDAQTVRMDVQGGDYMLVRDGNAYMVSHRGGQPMVIDLSAMRQAMGGMAGSAGPAAPAAGPSGGDALVEIEATGRTETVAGIEGEIYRVVYRDDGGQGTQEMVLSDDPLAVEMTQAWFAAIAALSGGNGGADADRMDRELAERGLGLLRAGDDFKVSSISAGARAAGDFELPAEPQAMPGMGR
ncbi:hypothetical protein PC39_04792 [Salinisphaera sp. PC39]|uniref:hypothetical protein n=1 Tax=Salinisphaera sp. PC39 TaxID=1304156 RepID=UPI00333FB90A